MNQFERDGRRIKQVRVHVETFAGCIGKQRPHTLATIEYGIAHGVVQTLRRFVCCGESLIEARIHTAGVLGDAVFEFVRQGSSIVRCRAM